MSRPSTIIYDGIPILLAELIVLLVNDQSQSSPFLYRAWSDGAIGNRRIV